MKLISCHIENFGNISGQDFDFSDGLTAINRPNGFGKTTLASFIKAMFYGLKGDRANTGFNDRRRFLPFSGGNFGGYLIFEKGGDEYKIERYFDSKSEVRDSLSVYKNGVADASFSGCVGERVFEIDRESFERTAFITADDVEISPTGGISAKLNVLLEGSGEDNNLENAIKELDERAKYYKKQRQGNDKITEETQKIAELKERIAGRRTIAENLPEKYARLNDLGEKISALHGEIDEAQSASLLKSNWDRYDGDIKKAEELKKEGQKIAEKYPMGMPDDEDAARLSSLLSQKRQLEASSKIKTFSDEDGAKLTELRLKFREGAPTEEEIAKVEEQAGRLSSLQSELDFQLAHEDTAAEKKLRFKFGRGTPSDEDIAAVDKNFGAYKNLSGEKVAAPPKKNKLSILVGVLAAITVAAAIGGIVPLAMGVTTIGIVLLTMTFACAAATVALYLGMRHAKPAAGGDSGEKERYIAEIQAKLLPYGYSFEYGCEHAVASFKEDLKEFGELQKKDGERKERTDGLKAEAESIRLRLEKFFEKYGCFSGNYIAQIAKLRADLGEISALSARKKAADESERELGQKIKENAEYIAALCRKLGLSGDISEEVLSDFAADKARYFQLLKSARETEDSAREFALEKGLTTRPEGEIKDLSELNFQLKNLQRDRALLDSEVAEEEREAEDIDWLEGELLEAEENLKEYKRKYELIENTKKFLRLADDRLKEKYVRPIKDKFNLFAAPLERALGEKITFGGDFEIRFLQDGQERSVKHLSDGQKSLCALCFRLALLENMYGDDKPFIILDDPFVHLDEEHLKRVKTLLSDLAERWQLIYFSCHESRKV